MNWEAVGAIAETLGAIAVIVSIAYLAMQVRQTRLQLQAQAEDNIMSRAFEAYSPVYDGDHARVFRKGLRAPDTLDEDEAFLFRLLMDRQRGAFGMIVRRMHGGTLPKELLDSLLVGYRQLFLETEGGRQWLDEMRPAMSRHELRVLEDRPGGSA